MRRWIWSKHVIWILDRKSIDLHGPPIAFACTRTFFYEQNKFYLHESLIKMVLVRIGFCILPQALQKHLNSDLFRSVRSWARIFQTLVSVLVPPLRLIGRGISSERLHISARSRAFLAAQRTSAGCVSDTRYEILGTVLQSKGLSLFEDLTVR